MAKEATDAIMSGLSRDHQASQLWTMGDYCQWSTGESITIMSQQPCVILIFSGLIVAAVHSEIRKEPDTGLWQLKQANQ